MCHAFCSAQLYLSNIRIGDAGAADLAKALATNPTLTHVRMAWHTERVTGRAEARTNFGCGAHCPFVPTLLCSAQLYLNGNQIGDAGAAELAKALTTNSTLIHVCMAWHIACLTGRGEVLIDVECGAHFPIMPALPLPTRCSSISTGTRSATLELRSLRRLCQPIAH